jgi:hypothetical protein
MSRRFSKVSQHGKILPPESTHSLQRSVGDDKRRKYRFKLVFTSCAAIPHIPTYP